MVVIDMTSRGTVPLWKLPWKSKINAEYYIEHALKPILEIQVAPLYPGEMGKVPVHRDPASSGTPKKPTAYSAGLKHRLEMTIIPDSETPV